MSKELNRLVEEYAIAQEKWRNGLITLGEVANYCVNIPITLILYPLIKRS